jgi:hypothetical protein
MLQTACLGLDLTSNALYTELEAGGDLADVEGGTLTPKELRLPAKAIAQEGRCQEVLDILQAQPGLTHAVVTHPELEQRTCDIDGCRVEPNDVRALRFARHYDVLVVTEVFNQHIEVNQ